MERKFGKNSIDIEALREFCEREGKEVTYRKGDQLERENPLTPRSGIFLQKRRIYNKMNNQNKKIDNEIYYNNTFEFISLATGDGGKSD